MDLRSRPGVFGREVATRKNGRRDLDGLATGFEALRGGLMSRHHFEVATWGANKGGRDMERDVATWLSCSRKGPAGLEVATSCLRSRHGCLQGRSRHGVAT